jgi:hypothetical protein
MDTNTYITLATKTESLPASLDMNQFALHAFLELAIKAGSVMDLVKRRLFYGQEIDMAKMGGDLDTLATIADFILSAADGALSINDRLSAHDLRAERLDSEDPDLLKLDDTNLNIRLLHAAIGGFTESTEKLEALKAQFEGKGLDVVNYAEEVGDTEWYGAIEKDELTKLSAGKVTEASIRLTNIEKLQGNGKLAGRYADGDFDAVRALRRNLDNERIILEKGVQ